MVTMLASITKLVSKCARGMNERLLKTSCADVLSSRNVRRRVNFVNVVDLHFDFTFK